MTMKETVWAHYERILDDEAFTAEKCDFIAESQDGIRRRVYMADVIGLDHAEHPNCHIVLDLYYGTHFAMAIPFAGKKDAWEYVYSKGKIDKRITKKVGTSQGWKLTLKGEVK